MDAYRAHAAPPAAQIPDGAVTATWYGNTAVMISDGRSHIFIDPFFTRPPGLLNMLTNRMIAPDEALIRKWLERAQLKHIDAVIASHSHYDHAMDAGVVARLTGATLYGSESTANIGRGGGLPENRIQILKAAEEVHIGEFTVSLLESRHAGKTGGKPTGNIVTPLGAPAHYLDYRQGGTWSILIRHPRGSVLHHGSAGFVPGMMIGRHADVVLLGIAIIPDLETYLREVVDPLGATRVLPMHWDDFTRPLDEPLVPLPIGVDLDGFFHDLPQLRPQLKLETFQVGVPVVLFTPAA
jgi:L-ascorbate metabolism protein UlaG (beta-lactamase superfamily)